jgi:phosphopentomutase
MSEIELLKRIADDVAVLKKKVEKIEILVDGIDQDLHRELNPTYVKKLKKIEKEKTISFKNMEEFDEHYGVSSSE